MSAHPEKTASEEILQPENSFDEAPRTELYYRAVSDLVRQEVSRLRGHAVLDPWTPETRLDSEDSGAGALGLKSLNLMDIATTVSDMFRIGKAGLDDLLLAKRSLGEWAEIALRAQDILNSFNPATGGVCFKTSGTTGAPKKVWHCMPRLQEEVSFWATIFQDRTRIISAVPGHHIYGFIFTCLLPARLGIDVVDMRYSMPGSVLDTVQDGDLIVGQPDFWKRIAETSEQQGIIWPDGLAGVSSTAPLSLECGDKLAACGLTRLVEVYGSTESLAVGWRALPTPWFSLLPIWEQEETGAVVHAAEKFTAPLQDMLEWHDDGAFSVTGRLDGKVQIGSRNVCLRSMGHSLETIDGLEDCTLEAKEGPNGTRLVAHLQVPNALKRDAVYSAVHQALVEHLDHSCEPEIQINKP